MFRITARLAPALTTFRAALIVPKPFLRLHCSATMAKEWSVTLNTGAKMPALGLGTWLSKPGEVGAATEAALKAGYRHIDCAHLYNNEAEVGEALQKCFKEGVCKREDVFITSKIWVTDLAYEDVLPACELSLKNLQLDYLDLYLIHWSTRLAKGAQLGNLKEEDKLGYKAEFFGRTWEAMEGLVPKGLTRAIGISNFTITKTENLLKTAKIVPAVNQVECHPYLQQPKLLQYCQSKGIVLEAYSPLGNPGNPFKGKDTPSILENPTIKEIAQKHGATVGQVCISFALHRGLSVNPKTVNLKRIPENLQSAQLALDDDDMQRLRGLNQDLRMLNGAWFLAKGETLDDMWDTEADKNYVIS